MCSNVLCKMYITVPISNYIGSCKDRVKDSAVEDRPDMQPKTF